MGQRLLLVDSDRSFLKEHQVSLEAAFDLEVVASPEGVLQRLERGTYAAVLICVEVADNKGYALCSTIRKNSGLDGVRIILISAKATEEEYRRHQSLKGRADLYLHKPLSPTSLVAALSAFVPARAVDPDNPLGELADAELGEDWLDGLKHSLDGAPAPAAAAAPKAVPAPVAAPAAPATPAAARATLPPDTNRIQLLESQVAALQEELRGRDRQIQELEHQQVTLNLDQADRTRTEVEAVRTKLREVEAERDGLAREAESLNQQLADKGQRAVDLLKERDRLLHQVADLETELEAGRAATEAAKVSEAHLHTTIEEMVAKQAVLEDLHQSALLEVAGYKEKAHTFQLELAGLEATMRGQARDLADLGAQVREREGEVEALRTQLGAKDQQLQEWEAAIQAQREEVSRLSGQLAALRQELDASRIQHEGEQLELMNGLDRKEEEIGRLNGVVGTLQEAQTLLEREKQTVQGQLAEHRDRLQNLDQLLRDIQEQLRRGSDLARG